MTQASASPPSQQPSLASAPSMSSAAPSFVPRQAGDGIQGRELAFHLLYHIELCALVMNWCIQHAGGRGRSAPQVDPHLPDGDDFLGMTAHTPVSNAAFFGASGNPSGAGGPMAPSLRCFRYVPC